MKDIGLIFWLLIICYIPICYLLFKELNRKHYLGDRVLKVKHVTKNYFLFFWIFLMGLWLYILVSSIMTAAKFDSFNDLFFKRSIILFFANMILAILNIIRNLKNREIRQKGITTSEGLINWKDIKSHSWINDNEVVIIISRKVIFWQKEIKKVWKVNRDQKVKVEELLTRFIYQ